MITYFDVVIKSERCNYSNHNSLFFGIAAFAIIYAYVLYLYNFFLFGDCLLSNIESKKILSPTVL